MPNDTTEDEFEYQVVVNEEEQYSIWRVGKEIPRGWRPDGTRGARKACLEHIERVWVDMRPLSLRTFMDRQAAGN
ncbi:MULTISPECIES: MbtH family protein [unclassified Amycolatopsis]|uniref:MbtH family protein n=1 Tax=unclassified Amycolatopsis TaxID=2618356 RepID=UPI002E165C30|nr:MULTISPECIES: MbtH family NRPS accessory protein [unclassified Amycolatopsis]WSJ78224.1 MbtH family NRPS accessory protein [Amycolatopsis sp. NBC_01307]WSK78212.1 MbtH family NRPS accessory protein [Amycolatopsis sp. NBC_01286]